MAGWRPEVSGPCGERPPAWPAAEAALARLSVRTLCRIDWVVVIGQPTRLLVESAGVDPRRVEIIPPADTGVRAHASSADTSKWPDPTGDSRVPHRAEGGG